MSVGDNLLWWYPQRIICFVWSAFIYVNSIITRGHFLTLYHEITFSANKQQENTIARELSRFCHSELLVKKVEGIFSVAACLFACLGEFLLRTDKQDDNLVVCLSDLERMPLSRQLSSLDKHLYTTKLPRSSKIFFKKNLWSKNYFIFHRWWVDIFFDKQNSIINIWDKKMEWLVGMFYLSKYLNRQEGNQINLVFHRLDFITQLRRL